MSTCPTAPGVSSSPAENAFVGRQPIFTPDLEVFAYELLFRSGEQNAAMITDGDRATANVLLNTFTDIGLDTIVGSKKAFINLTRNLLTGRNLSCMPADRVVLEILEDIQPDADVLSAIEGLVEEGYTIALDDFVYRPELEPLIGSADIVKIEYPLTPKDQLPDHIGKLRALGVRTILAEKIETQEDFELCKSLGCDLFQGYFFCRPQVISQRKTQVNVASVVRLMSELQNPDITMNEVEGIIQTDANLSFKLLRFVNSANAATTRTIDSLKQATTLMGIARLRSLASMMLMTSIDEGKPQELIRLAMIRGKMCEQLAVDACATRPDRFYTLGLLSVMDALLDKPMEEVIPLLPLADDMNDALLSRAGELGLILQSVINFEAGQMTPPVSLSAEQMTKAYQTSLRWIASITN
ncbi:HDOD domain protein [Stieleria maiorica]|uniref:HDOD domain protein n=1 Tax=Stieleria maiorica TaxID=2795974 RepID=A0A5B9MK72_9BACT|nr:HDOD domain-containing protein [Stieleria maiorica]QEG00085.1 HDOD domain protein [Stieleria maiorica]